MEAAGPAEALEQIIQTQDITIQTDHQPDATNFQFIILKFIYSSTCFGRSTAHHQELNDCSSSLWFLSSYRDDSRAVFVVGPVKRPDHEHSTTVTTIRR
jgi:hypothetical protein